MKPKGILAIVGIRKPDNGMFDLIGPTVNGEAYNARIEYTFGISKVYVHLSFKKKEHKMEVAVSCPSTSAEMLERTVKFSRLLDRIRLYNEDGNLDFDKKKRYEKTLDFLFGICQVGDPFDVKKYL